MMPTAGHGHDLLLPDEPMNTDYFATLKFDYKFLDDVTVVLCFYFSPRRQLL